MARRTERGGDYRYNCVWCGFKDVPKGEHCPECGTKERTSQYTEGPKPFSIVAQFPSSSSSAMHEVRKSKKTSAVYCTCPGWAYNDKCWHMRDTIAKLNAGIVAA